MKFAFYIADRYSRKSAASGFILSKPMMRIATFGIVLGVAVMIVSIAIIIGFKHEIREKVTGFSSHIQLVNRDLNKSYEMAPIDNSWGYISEIENYEHVKTIQPFITKPGVLKKDDEIEAVILKGIDSVYDWSFFSKYIKSGEVLYLNSNSVSDGIVLSSYVADRLKLKVGDRVDMFFMQNPVRMRRFTLTALYETSLKTYDELYAIVDLRHLQKLNDWEANKFSGFEIMVDDFEYLENVYSKVSDRVALDFNQNDESLRAVSTIEMAPQIYDWLQLQDMNVWVILTLLTLVAGINMITGVLINILEKTNQIGLFKAMGATDRQVMSVFTLTAARIIGKGMLWGNLLGFAFCAIQYYTGIISLDPDNYYLTEVPIYFSWNYFLILNIAVFFVNLLMMLLPGLLISRIRPVDSMKFD